MRTLSTLLLFSSLVFGQSVAVGIKGGVPFKDAYNASGIWSGASSSWTVGPTVELRLPFGLGAEFDALYRKTAYNGAFPQGNPQFTASQWQFPLLAKVRIPSLLVHPFIDGGVVFNKLSYQNSFGPTAGGVVGLGAELKLGKIRVGPELRYTRWGAGNTFVSQQGQVVFNQNQFDLLLGMTWGK